MRNAQQPGWTRTVATAKLYGLAWRYREHTMEPFWSHRSDLSVEAEVFRSQGAGLPTDCGSDRAFPCTGLAIARPLTMAASRMDTDTERRLAAYRTE